MSRNGAGTYSLPAGNPVVTGTTVSSTWANNTLSDIATALTQSLAYDGQTVPTANLPMGSFKHTGVANSSARTHYSSAADVQDGTLVYLTAVAGTDTITATAAVTMTAYATGQKFHFVSAGANTGAVTININSIGAKSITKNGTTALAAADIPSGAALTIIYDGTRFQIDSIKVDWQAKANVFTEDQTLRSADAGATAGPNLILDRNSASPAASDVLGAIPFKGRDSGAGTDTYAQIQAEIVDATAASEDGKLAFKTAVAGTLGTAAYVAQGIVVGSPTGGDKGAGTVNVQGLYIDGSSITSSTTPLGVLKAGIVNLPQSATRYLSTLGTGGESTEDNAEYWVPRPITVSQMRAKLSANVAASQTIAVTLRKNGADTSCTFTISAGASTGEDTSNSVDFSTGDRLAIKVVTSAAFGTTTDIGVTLKTSIYNTSIGTTLGLCFNTIGHPTTSTSSFGEPGGSTNAASQGRAEVPLSAGVIVGRTFITSIPSGGTIVVRKNNTTVSKSTLVAAGDFDSGEYLFSTANDLYTICKTTTGNEDCAGYVRLENPPGAAFNFAPAPTFFTSTTQAQNTTFFMGGYVGTASTTEADVQIPMPACTIRNFRAAADAAPPAGQTCTLTLRKNGADTAITCTITSAGRTSSDTSNSVTYAAGDLLTVKCVSSATAGTLTYNVSLEPYV